MITLLLSDNCMGALKVQKLYCICAVKVQKIFKMCAASKQNWLYAYMNSRHRLAGTFAMSYQSRLKSVMFYVSLAKLLSLSAVQIKNSQV